MERIQQSYEGLGDEGLQRLCTVISDDKQKLPRIVELDIGGNELTKAAVGHLVTLLPKLENLEVLSSLVGARRAARGAPPSLFNTCVGVFLGYWEPRRGLLRDHKCSPKSNEPAVVRARDRIAICESHYVFNHMLGHAKHTLVLIGDDATDVLV